jgi:hypothetical protein
VEDWQEEQVQPFWTGITVRNGKNPGLPNKPIRSCELIHTPPTGPLHFGDHPWLRFRNAMSLFLALQIGAPVAGKFQGSPLLLVSALRTFHQAFISMGVFRFQHLSAGSAKSATSQKHGPSIHANSTTTVLSVAPRLILAVPWRFSQDATSYARQPLVRPMVIVDVLLLTLAL